MRLRHFVLITGKMIIFMSICFAKSVEEPFEPPHDKTNYVASAQSDQSLRCPHEERVEP